jgi:hypothetical protein
MAMALHGEKADLIAFHDAPPFQLTPMVAASTTPLEIRAMSRKNWALIGVLTNHHHSLLSVLHNSL